MNRNSRSTLSQKIAAEFNHAPLFFVSAGMTILFGVLVNILVIFG